MKRNINTRTLFNNIDMYDRYQNNTEEIKETKKETKKETQIDFCDLDNTINEITEHETLNEIDILLEQYFYFSKELKRIRGRLYNLGIDPLNMGYLNNK